MIYGYNGRILRVNLTTGKIRFEELGEEIYREYLGGKGLGTLIVYREVPPGTRPLSPGNKIVFAAGGLSGLAPGARKVAVVSKSPETRLIHDSHAGDAFGPMLKRAGFDAIVIEGVSRDPVYLWIHDGEAEIRDAGRLWGLGTRVATDRILGETSSDASVAVIGPAGENLVRYACIIFDYTRAAGRGGLGAVMGSKKLKAIAVYGSHPPETHDPVGLRKLSDELYEAASKDPSLEDLRKYGTSNAILASARAGMSPAYNFNRPYIPVDLASRLSGRELVKRLDKGYEAPSKVKITPCPIKCSKHVAIQYKGVRVRLKPEYENLAMLGAATGVFDFDTVAYYNYLVNDYGLDSIATGNTIAWLLELAEKKLISRDEVGFDVKGFGDKEAVEKLIRLIAERKGIGAVLAEGVAKASRILGRGWKYAVHVKRLEAPAWDPRGRRTYGLSYATADVGASHLRGWPHPHMTPSTGPAKDLVPSLIESRDRDSVFDHLGICKFMPYSLQQVSQLLDRATGWDLGPEDLRRVSARTEALARIHAVLDWVTPPQDDVIPPKWWVTEPEGPAAGNKAFNSLEDFLEARRTYYELRGWHPEYGVPLPEILRSLGLDWAVEDARKAISIIEKRLNG
jgi:aldehyde:ferredoxin oxidoreductase